MKHSAALKTILIISLAGLLFSGYLSYNELFAGGCSNAFIKCGSTFKLANLPACVYGFFMYLTILLITATSLAKRQEKSV